MGWGEWAMWAFMGNVGIYGHLWAFMGNVGNVGIMGI